MKTNALRRTGRVKWFNNEKGYGEIACKETKESFFFSYTSVELEVAENAAGSRSRVHASPGAMVSFVETSTQTFGRRVAEHVFFSKQ